MSTLHNSQLKMRIHSEIQQMHSTTTTLFSFSVLSVAYAAVTNNVDDKRTIDVALRMMLVVVVDGVKRRGERSAEMGEVV